MLDSVEWTKTASSAKVFIGLSAAGAGVAIYHAYDEITSYTTEVSNACHINRTFNCGATYPYSHLFGIPLYVFGIVWFPLLLIVSLLMLPNLSRRILFPILMVGNLFTLYLWYLDLAIVMPQTGAICPVCVSMYAINYVLTAVALLST